MFLNMTPSFDRHRHWIEDLITTPTTTPSPTRGNRDLLTHETSPTEHVLRGSRSFTARSYRSRTSAHSVRNLPFQRLNNENLTVPGAEPGRILAVSNAFTTEKVLGELSPNFQSVRTGPPQFGPSPTPSLKRKKVEAIVKAHGSPTHVRVTAGGRVVPSVQSPLCYPRYGYSAIKANGGLIKFAPNHQAGKPHWMQATENGFVAQDLQGNLCQIVNGMITPLNEIDGALQLHMPAPNLNVTKRSTSQGQKVQVLAQEDHLVAVEPSMSSQVSALELEYAKLEHELKDVDKTEVIHGRTMGKNAKEALVSKRRELVTGMDLIRRAIKGLKDQRSPPRYPAAHAQVPNRSSSSPRTNRLSYLHPRNQVVPGFPAYNSYWPGTQPPQYEAHYINQPMPSPDDMSNTQPWPMLPGAMYMSPPSFDGPNGSQVLSHAQPLYPSMPIGAPESKATAGNLGSTDATASNIPSDTATDALVKPAARSHALPIRIPNRKTTLNLKSTLNPMSPVYKPATSSSPSPGVHVEPLSKPDNRRDQQSFSPVPQLQAGRALSAAKNITDETVSPTKQKEERRSSSISSFNTADFFPRDTREFSTRQHAYPFKENLISEEKENVNPEHNDQGSDDLPATSDEEQHNSNWNPMIPDHAFKGLSKLSRKQIAPTAPPGTPEDSQNTHEKVPASVAPSDVEWPLQQSALDLSALPNRSAHNVSPKNKRRWPSDESSRQMEGASSSSKAMDGSRTASIIDFTDKPHEWIEGYRAGLQRQPVSADRDGTFLDGYCSGLLKSKAVPIGDPQSAAQNTTGPQQPKSRAPSPDPAEIASTTINPSDPCKHNQPLTFKQLAPRLDLSKQAVFDPRNENAILTPGLNGPHVSDHRTNLGAWAKKRGVGTSYHDTSISEDRQVITEKRIDSGVMPQGWAQDQMSDHKKSREEGPEITVQRPISPSSPAMSAKSINSAADSASGPNVNHRISSLTSIDSALYRPWPGHRVVSPHLDWKSASSVAHAAGLASGYFANVQFDGTHETLFNPGLHDQATLLTRPVHPTGAPSVHRQVGVSSRVASGRAPQPASPVLISRFTEGSIDGMSSPPMSPVMEPLSPRPRSPALRTPNKSAKQRKENSPSKTPSPAKAKFEHIAEKVGIKVASTSRAHEADADPRNATASPPGKRRWRDAWRKQTNKDEPI